MNIAFLITGLLLLFFGRRLFWLFVGLIGFAAGFAFAERLVTGQPHWVELAIAVAAGIIGILLALFLQKLAVALAGFFSGGYFGLELARYLGQNAAASEWWFFLIAGIVGAILLSFFFDYALILLSSVTGSALTVRAVPMEAGMMVIAFLALLVIGCLVQASWMRRRHVTVKNVAS